MLLYFYSSVEVILSKQGLIIMISPDSEHKQSAVPLSCTHIAVKNMKALCIVAVSQ